MKTGSDARPWAHEGSDFAQINNLLVFAGQKRAHELLRSGYLEEATKAIEGYRTTSVKTAGATPQNWTRWIDLSKLGEPVATRHARARRCCGPKGPRRHWTVPPKGRFFGVEVAGSEMLFDLPDPSLSGSDVVRCSTPQVEINCGRLKPFHIVVVITHLPECGI